MSQAFIKALRRSIQCFNDTLAAQLKLRENRDPLGPPRHQVGFRPVSYTHLTLPTKA